LRAAYLSRFAGALIALALGVVSSTADAQDTVAAPRHVLALDLSRLQPFVRSYDMIVHVGDSAHVIGQRNVTLTTSLYGGQPAWLLTESRTGIVPSMDSLFLGLDLRPLHWSSELGRSRLGAEFSGDSIFGATVTPTARGSMILGSRPDVLVSTGMIETLVALLPLTTEWSDSAAVLAVDAGEAVLLPAELAVTGEAQLVEGDSASVAWVIALRTERSQLQIWVEKSSGRVGRIEQQLPPHVGSSLEYRSRAVAVTSPE
jgi:hypothetical protein